MNSGPVGDDVEEDEHAADGLRHQQVHRPHRARMGIRAEGSEKGGVILWVLVGGGSGLPAGRRPRLYSPLPPPLRWPPCGPGLVRGVAVGVV